MPNRKEVELLVESFIKSHLDELAWDVILWSIYDHTHRN